MLLLYFCLCFPFCSINFHFCLHLVCRRSCYTSAFTSVSVPSTSTSAYFLFAVALVILSPSLPFLFHQCPPLLTLCLRSLLLCFCLRFRFSSNYHFCLHFGSVRCLMLVFLFDQLQRCMLKCFMIVFQFQQPLSLLLTICPRFFMLVAIPSTSTSTCTLA